MDALFKNRQDAVNRNMREFVLKWRQVRKGYTNNVYICKKKLFYPQSEGFTARELKCSYMGSKLTRGLKKERCLSWRKEVERGKGEVS